MSDRRNFLQQIVATGLLANMPLAISMALAAGDKPFAQGIHHIRGKVTVNGKTAREGMLIRPGDSIATGPDTETIYVIGQDAFLQREDSIVGILGDTIRSGLRIVNGKLLSVFGKGMPKRIQTSTATIGIRGTGCYIEAEPKRMYICLCYGEADFTPVVAPDKAAHIATRHHESPLWISGEDRVQPFSKAPMLNHTDAELALLESLLGRTPPFSSTSSDRY